MKIAHTACLFVALGLAPFISSLALWPSVANGQASTEKESPELYSHALSLDVSQNSGVSVVRLPPDVYQFSRSQTLADLRIFDATGTSIPFALQAPESKPATLTTLPRDVALFPVFGSRHKAKESAELEFQTKPDGTLLSVRSKLENKSQEKQLTYLILDLGMAPDSLGKNARINHLRFGKPIPSPSAQNQKNITTRIHYEGSQTLQQWTPLGSTELSWLTGSDNTNLLADSIDLPPRPYRYLRISWPDDTPVSFEKITAEWGAERKETPEYDILWLKAKAVGDENKKENKETDELLYEAGPAIPVEWINVRMPESNITFTVDIGRYALYQERRRPRGPSHPMFQPLWRKTFFHFMQNGEVRQSEALEIPPTHASEWVLRPTNPKATPPGLHKNPPQLGLGWRPASLVFVTSGTAPYRLVFGRSDASRAAVPLEYVAPGLTQQELAAMKRVTVGTENLHGSNSPNSPHSSLSGDTPTPFGTLTPEMRRMLLWASLLIGVAIIAGMAVHLLRNTSEEAPVDGQTDKTDKAADKHLP